MKLFRKKTIETIEYADLDNINDQAISSIPDRYIDNSDKDVKGITNFPGIEKEKTKDEPESIFLNTPGKTGWDILYTLKNDKTFNLTFLFFLPFPFCVFKIDEVRDLSIPIIMGIALIVTYLVIQGVSKFISNNY
jgi:hypothetical protein